MDRYRIIDSYGLWYVIDTRTGATFCTCPGEDAEANANVIADLMNLRVEAELVKSI